MAHDVAHRAGDADGEHDHPAGQVGHHAGIVAGKVQHLDIAPRRAQVKAHQGGEGNDGKGAGARAEPRRRTGRCPADAQRQQAAFFRVMVPSSRFSSGRFRRQRSDHRRDGQDDQHHGAQGGSSLSSSTICAPSALPAKLPTAARGPPGYSWPRFEKVGCGKSGAAGGAEFVGSIGVVGRQPGKQIGWQTDKTAASGCRIHKTCKARSSASRESHHPRRKRDTHCYNSSYLSNFVQISAQFFRTGTACPRRPAPGPGSCATRLLRTRWRDVHCTR